MALRSRLPIALLALVALVLGTVIVLRVSAGADPAPQDTSPIVITSPTATDTPTQDPPSGHGSDDGFIHISPTPRSISEDGGHQSGKGKGGGSDDGGGHSGKGSSGSGGGGN